MIMERQVVKCYLECHFAHKDCGKDVVGDGEEDSFLDTHTHRQRERDSQGEATAIMASKTLLTAPLR